MCLGPLEETEGGNLYCLVIQDYFTKWLEIYCIPNHKAHTVAKCVLHFICHYGCPGKIHTDQGREFTSRLFQDLCLLFHIKKTRTTPYTPWSDGGGERCMRSIVSIISTMTQPGNHDWDTKMDIVAAAYRATVHSSTGFTPNRLMFGRELNHPADLVYGRATDAPKFRNSGEYIQNLEASARSVWDQTRHNLKRSAEVQQKSREKLVMGWKFEVDDLVYRCLPPVAKMSKRW